MTHSCVVSVILQSKTQWLHAKPGTLKSVQQAFYFTKLNKPYDIQIGSKKWQQNISSIQRNRMKNETGQPASREPVDNGGSSQPITGSVRKADRPFWKLKVNSSFNWIPIFPWRMWHQASKSERLAGGLASIMVLPTTQHRRSSPLMLQKSTCISHVFKDKHDSCS